MRNSIKSMASRRLFSFCLVRSLFAGEMVSIVTSVENSRWQLPMMAKGPFFSFSVENLFTNGFCDGFSFHLARVSVACFAALHTDCATNKAIGLMRIMCDQATLFLISAIFFLTLHFQLTSPIIINNPISFLFIIFPVFFLVFHFPCVVSFVHSLLKPNDGTET